MCLQVSSPWFTSYTDKSASIASTVKLSVTKNASGILRVTPGRSWISGSQIDGVGVDRHGDRHTWTMSPHDEHPNVEAVELRVVKWKPLRLDLTRVQWIYGKAFSLPSVPLRCSLILILCLLYYASCFILQVGTSCKACTCLAIVHCPGGCVSFACFRLQTGTLCDACTCLRSKISWDIWQISCENGDRPHWSHQEFSKKLDAAVRFWKLLFPFAWAPAKCGRNGPSVQTRTSIRVRKMPKVLRISSRIAAKANFSA